MTLFQVLIYFHDSTYSMYKENKNELKTTYATSHLVAVSPILHKKFDLLS